MEFIVNQFELLFFMFRFSISIRLSKHKLYFALLIGFQFILNLPCVFKCILLICYGKNVKCKRTELYFFTMYTICECRIPKVLSEYCTIPLQFLIAIRNAIMCVFIVCLFVFSACYAVLRC